MAVTGQVLNLLVDYPDATYERIGSIVGCSRQRVHQIARKTGVTRMKPPHYRSDVTVDKVLELYHRDLLVNEIVPILGCCATTVSSRLREAGITIGERLSRGQRLHRLYHHGSDSCRIPLERVLNLYHNDDLSIKEMAQTLGCNQATVTKRLRKAGISAGECFSRAARIRWRRKKASGVAG